MGLRLVAVFGGCLRSSLDAGTGRFFSFEINRFAHEKRGAMTVLRPRMRRISIGMWICRLPLSATVMVGFLEPAGFLPGQLDDHVNKRCKASASFIG
jgi:hypothetical protein